MTSTPARFHDADVATLRGIWMSTLADFTNLATELSDTQWDEPSMCPGWSVGDVVAHTLALEAELHGTVLPDHEPDWAALPHVTSPLSRYTETPVDWYRNLSRDVVVGELAEMLTWRLDDVARDTASDPNEVVASIGGLQFPRAQMMRIRILDIWIHLQDIRLAIGSMGDLATDGAWIAAEQLTSGLPFVWAKQLAAPVGSSVHLVVTGPGPEFAVSVVVNDNGRGEIVEAIGSQPTVTATMDWLQYVQLAAGRAGALASANGGGVTLSGDPAIGQQLLAHFVVTP